MVLFEVHIFDTFALKTGIKTLNNIQIVNNMTNSKPFVRNFKPIEIT